MGCALVTGGTGFVGANLVRRLLHGGHEVHLLVRPGHAKWRLVGIEQDIRLHEVDLDDVDTLERIVQGVSPDWVFHLAVHGAYSSQADVDRIIATNLNGTINLLHAALRSGFEAFVNTGSSSEYGFQAQAPCESSAVEPNSHYAVTKAAATMYCRYSAQHYAVRIPTLRLYSVYGPWEEPTRLVPTLALRGLYGELPSLVDPNTARDYVYVDDVSDAFLKAATKPVDDLGAIYNIGSGSQTTLSQIVEIARTELVITDAPNWGTHVARKWDTDVWVSNPNRIARELGWRATTTLKDGFAKTVDWLRKDPQRLELYADKAGYRPATSLVN